MNATPTSASAPPINHDTNRFIPAAAARGLPVAGSAGGRSAAR